mmetsp:Transcript_30146/g.82853  ORF Transcript_30146/g.82853 Transcript_30146/m.82853 type:complete len:343 (+) Transcript_30146:204-1232(+)
MPSLNTARGALPVFSFRAASGSSISTPSTVTRSPTLAPAGACNSSTLPSFPVAQRTMPCEVMPTIFLLLRLARTMTSLPSMSSSFKCFRSPDKIVLGSPSPRSISSQYNFSASGCGHTFWMRPTLMFNREMSSNGRSAGFPLAACAFAFALPLAFPSSFPPASFAGAASFTGAASFEGAASAFAASAFAAAAFAAAFAPAFCSAFCSAFAVFASCWPWSAFGSTLDLIPMSLLLPSGILISTIGLPGAAPGRKTGTSTMKKPRRSSWSFSPLPSVFSMGSPIAGVSTMLHGLTMSSMLSSSSILALVTKWSSSRRMIGVTWSASLGTQWIFFFVSFTLPSGL